MTTVETLSPPIEPYLGLLVLVVLLLLVLCGVLLKLWQYHGQSLLLNERAVRAESQLLEATSSNRLSQELLTKEKEAKATLLAQLQASQARLEEERLIWNQMRGALADQFKSLAADSLRTTNDALLKSAEGLLGRFKEDAQATRLTAMRDMGELIKPIKESLGTVDGQIKQMESLRVGAYQGLKSQIDTMMKLQGDWAQEVTKLASALKSPVVRGKWGELQLRRVVELAGMLEYCDFFEQTVSSDGHNKIRPDMVVQLPGERQIIIDAKTPLTSFFAAMESSDDAQSQNLLKDFTLQVKRHITTLGQKNYWEQFKQSPEFVVLFLPGDHYYAAALRVDPSLVEIGAELKVVVATPSSLIGLLKAVAHGWRQEQVAESARLISKVGRELYGRIADFGRHMGDMGKSLESAMASYNKGLYYIDSRILVSARKLEALGIKDDKKKLASLEPLVLSRQEAPQDNDSLEIGNGDASEHM